MERNVEEEEAAEGYKSRAKAPPTTVCAVRVFQLGCGSHVNSHAHTRYRISIIFSVYYRSVEWSPTKKVENLTKAEFSGRSVLRVSVALL